MITGAISETASIGAVLPFLGILTAPNELFSHPFMQPFITAFGYETPNQLILPLTIGFILAALLAGTVRLTLLYVSTKLSFATGADISINIYERTLYQTYGVHISRNSSELINGIINKINTVISGVLMPFLLLISSSMILIAILIALLVFDPIIALTSIVSLGGFYGSIIWATRRHLEIRSRHVADKSTQVIKSLQEALGGIRDILIDGSQGQFCRIYRNSDLPLRHAQGDIHIIGISPKFVVEVLGMTVIAIVAYQMSQNSNGFNAAIPILGAIAIGAQRILPVLQQGYGAVSAIRGGKSSLIDTLDLLDQAVPNSIDNLKITPLTFQKEIRLKGVGFRYHSEASWGLKDINIRIKKGSRVGFIGETGSGKSTLLDIVMGLLLPSEGMISIDGCPVTAINLNAWQNHLAHVPQNIYLIDSTISENIAFGVPKDQIDISLVRKVAIQAQISELIESWPEKYETFVGERGIRISGGQRQRIGIARALYKKTNIIIFDEATSALDSKTEQAVMDAIDNLDKNLTILIIAHRLTTLKNCDQIIELGNERVVRTGRYKDLIIDEAI